MEQMIEEIIYDVYAIANENGYVYTYSSEIPEDKTYVKIGQTDSVVYGNYAPIYDDYGVFLKKIVDGAYVDTPDEDKLPSLLQNTISSIKQECERVITSRYDNWTQINAERQGMRLLEKMILDTMTPEDEVTLEGIRQAGDWIDNIRAQSNAMELEVSTISYNDLLNYDIIFNEEITS